MDLSNSTVSAPGRLPNAEGVRSLLGFLATFTGPLFLLCPHYPTSDTANVPRASTSYGAQTNNVPLTALSNSISQRTCLVHSRPHNPFILEVLTHLVRSRSRLTPTQTGSQTPPPLVTSQKRSVQPNATTISTISNCLLLLCCSLWRILLAGSPHKTRSLPDHLNLQYWRSPRKISRRIAREVLELSEYDLRFTISGNIQWSARCTVRWESYDLVTTTTKAWWSYLTVVFVRAMEV